MPVQRQFYREIQKWIREGMKDHPIFHKYASICSIYRLWGFHTDNKIHDMGDDFKTAGLDYYFPFNETVQDYSKELQTGSIYMNPRRLAWIKEHANPRPRITKSDNLN